MATNVIKEKLMNCKFENKILSLILLGGFLLKLIYLLSLDNTILANADSYEYNRIAMILLKEHRFSPNWLFFRPPFYPFFLYFIYKFSPENFLLVKIIQTFLVTIAAFFIFKVTSKFFSRRVALASVAIFSFHPYFIDISVNLLTEPVFLLLTAMSIYLLFRFYESGNDFTLLFISGIISAIAILTRPAFVIFLPVAILWLAVLKRKLNFIFKSSFILILSCLLALSPWIIRNLILFHEFNFCTESGGFNFYIGNSKENYERLTTRDYNRFKYLNNTGLIVEKTNNQIKEFEKKVNYSILSPKSKERLWYNAAFIYIKNNKIEWLKLLFLKAWDYLRPYLNPLSYPKKYVLGSLFLNGAIYLLGAGGLCSALKDKKLRSCAIFFVLYFLASIVIHALYLSTNRYRIVFIDPYLYMFASYAFLNLTMGISARKGPIFRK